MRTTFRTSLLLVLGAVAIAVVSAARPTCDPSDVECRWAAFKTDFGKTYATAEEETLRREIFSRKLVEIESLNGRHPEASFGVTRFSDLTRDEFRATLGRPLGPRTTHEETPPMDLEAGENRTKRATIPTTWTFPYMTPVHQPQGGCGACWSYSAMGTIEAQWNRDTGSKVELSVQQLLDCDVGGEDTGCTGGWPDQGMAHILKMSKGGGGAMAAYDYPYEEKDGRCRYNKAKAAAKITGVYSVKWNEAIMDQELFQRGPLAVTLDATTLQDYTGGILPDTPECRADGVNHAVILAGYGVDSKKNKYWLLKNSWGPDSGEKGYFRIARGKGACLLTTFPAAGVSLDPKTPKCKPSRTCKSLGGRQCGSIDDGCGTMISCGKCTSSQLCSPLFKCVSNGHSVTDWKQFLPAKASGDFAVTLAKKDVTITTKTTTSAQKGIMWVPSDLWSQGSYVSFAVSAKAVSGMVGLGLRLGQKSGSTDGLYLKFDVDSAKDTATGSFCQTLKGKTTCKALAKGLKWNKAGADELCLVVYKRETDLTDYRIAPWLGDDVVGGVEFKIKQSTFPAVGKAFLIATGGAKTFSQIRMDTETTMRASLNSCTTSTGWRAAVASALRVPLKVVKNVVGSMSPGSNCSSVKRQDTEAEATYNAFTFTLTDTDEVLLLGDGAFSAPSSSSSQQLASQLQEMASANLIGDVEISAMSVVPAAVAELPVVALETFLAGAAGLSTMAIASIAVGSVAALAAVAGAASAAVVVSRRRRRRRQEEEIAMTVLKAEPAVKVAFKSRVNVMGNSQRHHQSLTARGVPILHPLLAN